MKKHLKIAKAVLNYSWKDFIEYRGHLFFWVVMESQSFFVMYFLWMFVYKNHSVVSGYTLSAMITYYLVAYFVKQNTDTYFDWNIIIKVNNGYFSQFLFRPLTHRVYYFYHNIGEKTIRFLVLLPFLAILLFLVKSYFIAPEIVNIFPFVLALILSFLLNSFFCFLMGYTAFWTERSDSIIYFKDSLIYYLSGAMIPLVFFGDRVAGILELLPFRYFVSFPIEIYLGKVSTAQMQKGMFIAVFWLITFVFLDRVISFYGLKRFSSVGN